MLAAHESALEILIAKYFGLFRGRMWKLASWKLINIFQSFSDESLPPGCLVVCKQHAERQNYWEHFDVLGLTCE